MPADVTLCITHPRNAPAFRFSEDDFRERSAGGIEEEEEDWPIRYAELAPAGLTAAGKGAS